MLLRVQEGEMFRRLCEVLLVVMALAFIADQATAAVGCTPCRQPNSNDCVRIMPNGPAACHTYCRQDGSRFGECLTGHCPRMCPSRLKLAPSSNCSNPAGCADACGCAAFECRDNGGNVRVCEAFRR